MDINKIITKETTAPTNNQRYLDYLKSRTHWLENAVADEQVTAVAKPAPAKQAPDAGNISRFLRRGGEA